MRIEILLLLSAVLRACEAEPTPEPVSECDPNAPYADKVTCDDNDPATIDQCVASPAGDGVCASIRAECDGADPPEVQAARCDDGNPCTADRCNVSACAHSAAGNCAL